jgi:hypothetical protein
LAERLRVETAFEQRRDEVVAALVALAERTPSIGALWLQGSLARGDADALSDVDAYLAIEDAAFDSVFERRLEMIGGLRPVLASADATVPGLKCVHALLGGGVRLDLYFEKQSDIGGSPRPAVKVLVDRAGVGAQLRTGWAPAIGAIGRTIQLIVRMTRQGGTWPLRVLLREQWSTFAMMELDLINAQLAQLMAVAADPANFFQNPFSLSRRLGDAERSQLDALTSEVLDGVARRDRAALLATHLRILDGLVREGRAACTALGVDYPISEAGDADLKQLLEEAWPR